jgi:CBS domain-containing protein
MRKQDAGADGCVFAADVMRPNPEIVHVDHSIMEAATRMRNRDTGVVFATDGDELVGVLTDRDIVTRTLSRGERPDDTPVFDAMTKHVVTVRARDPLAKVVATMIRDRVRRLAVVDDNRELVGVIGVSDLAGSDALASLQGFALRSTSKSDRHSKRPRHDHPAGGRAKDMKPARAYAVLPKLKHRPS